jgi:hypothetical protein
MSALFVSLDGLILVLSRIGLADTILTLFLLSSIYTLLRKNYYLSALFWGMALSIKWTSLYLLPAIIIITYLKREPSHSKLNPLQRDQLQNLPQRKNLSLITQNILNPLKPLLLFIGAGPIIHAIIQTTVSIATTITSNTNTQQLSSELSKSIKPELVFSFLTQIPQYLSIGFIFVALYLYASKINLTRSHITRTIKTILTATASYFGIGTTIYLLSYLPLFLYGYSIDKFIALQNQMYWYHTGLDATHPYQSAALTWPINLRPVWFWVDYAETTTANIYALGNPTIFWLGFIAVCITLGYYYLTKQKRLLYLLLLYFTFWVPWIFSPRIMFLYHYLPAVPYLIILLSFTLDLISRQSPKLKYLPHLVTILILAAFIFFYPYLTGIPVAKEKVIRYQWFESWK